MKKNILSVILSLGLAVNLAFGIEFKTGISNGLVLPSGVQMTKKTATDFSVSGKSGDFKISLWKVSSSDYEETDITISYKNFTLGFFDIPGENDIVFTSYNHKGYVFKTFNPKGKKSGVQVTKNWKIRNGFSTGLTVGTSPFSGDYLFTPGISWNKKVANGVNISANYKHPMGEVSSNKMFDPSLIVKLNFSF